jgi:tripartite-type tricarboxylate transporter receptor subunit TctC
MFRVVALSRPCSQWHSPASAPACAQPEPDHYPSRPIKLVVPFPAGTLTDVVARTFADKLSTQLGKPVLVENKPERAGARRQGRRLG